MLIKLFLAFTLIPIVELYLLIKIGKVIGAVSTIALVILTGAAGAALAKAQGIKVISEINSTAAQGKLPANEMLQGLILLVGGITLLTPGLITDLLGLSMIIPPTRSLYAKWLQNYFSRKIASGNLTINLQADQFSRVEDPNKFFDNQ